MWGEDSCSQAQWLCFVALHDPRYCYASERFFPVPDPVPPDMDVPVSMATVKGHLSGCLTRARYSSFEDAWHELKLGHWVWYNEAFIKARHSGCPMSDNISSEREMSMPWANNLIKPKASPKALCKAKAKAHGKFLAKAKLKAKAKAQANNIPQVIAQPHADALPLAQARANPLDA